MSKNDKLLRLVLDLTNILDQIDEMQCLIIASSLCDSCLEDKTLAQDLLNTYKEKIDKLLEEYRYLNSIRISTF